MKTQKTKTTKTKTPTPQEQALLGIFEQIAKDEHNLLLEMANAFPAVEGFFQNFLGEEHLAQARDLMDLAKKSTSMEDFFNSGIFDDDAEDDESLDQKDEG
jgi:hypothetical protein